MHICLKLQRVVFPPALVPNIIYDRTYSFVRYASCNYFAIIFNITFADACPLTICAMCIKQK